MQMQAGPSIDVIWPAVLGVVSILGSTVAILYKQQLKLQEQRHREVVAQMEARLADLQADHSADMLRLVSLETLLRENSKQHYDALLGVVASNKETMLTHTNVSEDMRKAVREMAGSMETLMSLIEENTQNQNAMLTEITALLERR